MVIFSAKKFSRQIEFFRFLQKKMNKKFIFLEKKSIAQKGENELNFLTSCPWKWKEIVGGKICLKKTVNRGIFGRFLRNFRKSCLLPLVVDARSSENICPIFQPTHPDLLKNPIFRFLFRFCSEKCIFSQSRYLSKVH